MRKPSAKNLFDRIDQGVKEGVARALEEHGKAGNKVFIWRRGRIARVSASRIKLLERRRRAANSNQPLARRAPFIYCPRSRIASATSDDGLI